MQIMTVNLLSFLTTPFKCKPRRLVLTVQLLSFIAMRRYFVINANTTMYINQAVL